MSTTTEWDRDVGDITCPKCGESIGNPYAGREEIADEAEEYVECEFCEVGMWVVANYRPQFRFTAHAEEPTPTTGESR